MFPGLPPVPSEEYLVSTFDEPKKLGSISEFDLLQGDLSDRII